jgi:hypothetical protein
MLVNDAHLKVFVVCLFDTACECSVRSLNVRLFDFLIVVVCIFVVEVFPGQHLTWVLVD